MVIIAIGATPATQPSILWMISFFVLAFFVLELGYFAGQEILLGGQTLGKRLVGLRVVASRGGRASVLSLLLRNLVRTFDLLVGMWFLVFDRRARRIGDHLAGTLVVFEQPETSKKDAVHRVPRGWGADRIALVETFFGRLDSLEPETADRLSHFLVRILDREDPSFLEPTPSDFRPTTRLFGAFAAGEQPRAANKPESPDRTEGLSHRQTGRVED